MKTKKTTFFILILLISSSLFSQERFKEQITVPLSSPVSPGHLLIDHIKGSINVIGYDGNVVLISASYRQKQVTASGNMKLIPSNPIQLSCREQNNEFTVTTNSHSKTIDLEINLPHKFSLNLSTYHNGKISVHNVSGELEISNINGDIDLMDITGSAVANSIDGDITVRFKEITPEIPMVFTTIYGKIDVTFPHDLKALAKIKTDRGEIYSDFDMEMEKRKPLTDKSEKSGIRKVFLEDWTLGKINGGGPEIMLKSYDGSIYIRKGNQ